MHLNRLFGRVSLSMFPFHSPGTGEEMGKLQDDGVRKIPDRGVNATKSKAGFHGPRMTILKKASGMVALPFDTCVSVCVCETFV